MDATTEQDMKPANPLIPVKSIFEWKPPSETIATIVHMMGRPDQKLETYKALCGKEQHVNG